MLTYLLLTLAFLITIWGWVGFLCAYDEGEAVPYVVTTTVTSLGLSALVYILHIIFGA